MADPTPAEVLSRHWRFGSSDARLVIDLLRDAGYEVVPKAELSRWRAAWPDPDQYAEAVAAERGNEVLVEADREPRYEA